MKEFLEMDLSELLEMMDKPIPLMLDLCSGLGGANQAFRNYGWNVLTVDNNPEFCPDVVADITTWVYEGEQPDLIWASPPCVEFSRDIMPWIKTATEPDMSIVLACKRIIDEVKPRFWIIENVRGAIKHFKPVLGNYRTVIGPFFLWGFFPPLGNIDTSEWKKKESFSSTKSAERANIPYALSKAVVDAIERQTALF